MRPFLQVLHFIDEHWGLPNEANNLMLVTLSIYCFNEMLLRLFCKELGHWLDREVDCHYIIVFLYFNIASVLLKEFVNDTVLELSNLLAHIRQTDRQLVNQTVDVEPFCNFVFKRVLVQVITDHFKCHRFKVQGEVVNHELVEDFSHTLCKYDEVIK